MNAPDKIYFDERLAPSLPTDPDSLLKKNAVNVVCYVREDVARQQIANAMDQCQEDKPQEKIIQICSHNTGSHPALFGLTSTGRVFELCWDEGDKAWNWRQHRQGF